MEFKDIYNDEPVYFCKSCLSLAIMEFKSDFEIDGYCNNCGSTDIDSAHIDVWNNMYEKRNRIKFIDSKRKK